VELIDLPEFGPDAYAQIVDGEPDPFGTDHLGIEWGPKSHHVGLMDDGRLIGHAGWVASHVGVMNGETIEVLGLGGVLVHRRFRGNGVGRVLVAGAMQHMRMQGGTIAMLFCRPERLRFYGDLGWFPIAGAVTVGQPGGPIVMPLRTCWHPLVEGATVPDGAMEFPGRPF
jgi:predicted N-acetyltransferase YhbS